MEYFETVHTEPGQEFPTTTAHDTLEEAITFAEAHDIPTVYGFTETFEKCWFCGEWFPIEELTEDSTCHSCRLALWSRGEYNR